MSIGQIPASAQFADALNGFALTSIVSIQHLLGITVSQEEARNKD